MINPAFESRVLVLAPTGRDGPLAASVLRGAGIDAEVTGNAAVLRARIQEGASAVLLSEEAMVPAALSELAAAIEVQPAWSDLPILAFTAAGGQNDQRLDLLREILGNVTFLERPLRTVTLVTAVRMALRARRRQYEMRQLLEKGADDVRQRDNFLAMLGHELRNPLAAILMASDLMDRSRLETFASPRALIRRQTKHLARLVDDLLDVARVTSGKIVLRRDRIDLVELVQRGFATMEPAARRERLYLSLDVSATPIRIDGDPVRMEQIVSNLLTNAIKYTPAGGRIDIRLAVEDGIAVLRVRDSGVGISSEMLPRLFDLFTQADRTLDRSQGGMGIGLNVVQRLVELHGGSIEASSQGLGYGSEFTVRLPAIPHEVAEPATAEPVVTTGRCSVVIIEDQEDFRELFREALETLGHEVDVAAEGQEGWDLLKRRRPDIAFVDVGLPKIDGYEIARRSKHESLPTRLVAVTGYGQPDDRERAFAAGFDVHLTKPLKMRQVEELLSAIDDPVRAAASANLH